jgi:allantoinase
MTATTKVSETSETSNTPAYDLVVRSRRVILPDGERPAAVAVRAGVIASVGPYDAAFRGAVERDIGSLALLPGLVDTHVHVNEPGRTHWEGFASATRAAAAGGVTTLIDMPLNSIPPTVDVGALAVKHDAAAGQCFIDVGFWGGAVPGNSAEFAGLRRAGVFGFKCFLADSGVEEFPALTPAEMAEALREIQSFDGLLIVHAEDAATLAAAANEGGRRYETFLASRPRAAEHVAVDDVIDAVRRTGGRAHILHLSSQGSLPRIEAAKAEGLNLTVETCPHYLTFDAEAIAPGSTQFKCCPPIRGADNREALWSAVADGTIDIVVSDHSPSTPDLKRLDSGDFGAAWGGISSLQLGLSAVWTGAAERGYALTDVVDWMARRTAALVGLTGKGRIAEGFDADLVVFDPDRMFTVDADALHHKNPVTPYAGLTLRGVVESTYLRGVSVSVSPNGRILRG